MMSRLQAAVLFVLWLAPSALADSRQSWLHLKIAGHEIQAEVASTETSRNVGLMYRKELAEDHGMLFVFPNAAPHSMWMVNTYIPLSVAFLDRDGVILNIATMKPLSSHSHAAAGDALYALEMTAGWFGKRGIKPGGKVEGLKAAPQAK